MSASTRPAVSYRAAGSDFWWRPCYVIGDCDIASALRCVASRCRPHAHFPRLLSRCSSARPSAVLRAAAPAKHAAGGRVG